VFLANDNPARSGSRRFALQAGAEPIPGYVLVSLICRGELGDVWKCAAPGGLFKAIKVLRDEFDTLAIGRAGAERDWDALQRVQRLWHTSLVPMDRIEIVENHLVIISDLVDRHLGDELARRHAEGERGIAPDQLLAYLRETADVLDWLNINHGIQHLGVKPSNLFMVLNHVKLGDFGLIRGWNEDEIENHGAPAPTACLPRYVPPESFRGEISPYSDQYLLALTYCELLTGRFPYKGATALELKRQHAGAPPDLDLLPDKERQVVARALAKDPYERYSTCAAFVQALTNAACLAEHPDKDEPSKDRDEPIPAPPARAAASPRAKSVDDASDTSDASGWNLLEPTDPPAARRPQGFDAAQLPADESAWVALEPGLVAAGSPPRMVDVPRSNADESDWEFLDARVEAAAPPPQVVDAPKTGSKDSNWDFLDARPEPAAVTAPELTDTPKPPADDNNGASLEAPPAAAATLEPELVDTPKPADDDSDWDFLNVDAAATRTPPPSTVETPTPNHIANPRILQESPVAESFASPINESDRSRFEALTPTDPSLPGEVLESSSATSDPSGWTLPEVPSASAEVSSTPPVEPPRKPVGAGEGIPTALQGQGSSTPFPGMFGAPRTPSNPHEPIAHRPPPPVTATPLPRPPIAPPTRPDQLGPQHQAFATPLPEGLGHPQQPKTPINWDNPGSPSHPPTTPVPEGLINGRPPSDETVWNMLGPQAFGAGSSAMSGTATQRPPSVVDSGQGVLPGYNFLDCMGRGLLGEVWKVQSTEGRPLLARIIVNPVLGPKTEPEMQAIFKDAAHPNVIAWSIASRSPQRLILLANAKGKTLQDHYLSRRSANQMGLSRGELLGCLRQVAAAVDRWSQARHLNHLGLSPRSIFWNEEKAQVVDGGLAQLLGVPAGHDLFHLNARYAAPELADNQCSSASDVYSLGILYYELVTGQMPHRGQGAKQLLLARRGGVPSLDLLPGVDRIAVAKALERVPERRFAACLEFVNAVEGSTTTPRRGSREIAVLTPIIAVRSDLPKGARPTELPAPEQFVTDWIDAATTLLETPLMPGMRARAKPGDVLIFQGGASTDPDHVSFKLKEVCAQWQCLLNSKKRDHYEIEAEAPSGWWKKLRGKQGGFRIGIEVRRPTIKDSRCIDLSIRVKTEDGTPEQSRRLVNEARPGLLDGLREALEAGEEQRRHARVIYPYPVNIIPVLPDRRMGDAIVCQGKDVSFGGAGFVTQRPLPSPQLYIQPTMPADQFHGAILAKVARVNQRADGSHEIGVLFACDAAPQKTTR
jgi:hypothetical protein